tara:strand:+ start:915 stop:1166 length:252 start_codon:yes stop_codon:yes gene_type:complete
MNALSNKYIIIISLSIFILSSCRAKKTFSGTETLDCANYDEAVAVTETKKKKKTKWRLVLYKDGQKVGGKSKRGKSRLFKNKN